MRVLRSTIWTPDLMPTASVVRDSDVVDTLESIRVTVQEPEFFYSFDLFEADDDLTIQAVTLEAGRRTALVRDIERNQAIQFYWAAQFLSKDLIYMPDPCPFGSDKIREVFDQLVRHPDYKHSTVRAIGDDGVEVWIRDGEVK